ncbi:phenylacetic acid degradation protein PaaN [Rhodospirillaceae bacterium KN72]|uniref:Phenylacetic acid degradation protein PaaN n=1 Tax=Pacificispira spongiicola TaxID=2729598 RepID=A0A7Y0HE39_9PROT|nr:phenylacetic acid degradation protein PaaN [Pacificispira spongiicola]NMM44315.1 phenylacetic acid degradation protein PaaN [Pacificispira spongiicola]
MATAYINTHRETLDAALSALKARDYWTPYSERASASVYGETAAADGEAAFKSYLGKTFDLPGHPGEGIVSSDEVSPYGIDLNLSYPKLSVDGAIAAATAAMTAWRDAGPDVRAGVCLEILDRINKRSFEMAHAVQHTTGQAFMMAFQAGGPHAQDRGLEAVAQAYSLQSAIPGAVRWTKPQGKNPPLILDKSFKIMPKGVAVTIGVSTFPTWNGYPGIMASLSTGNPVIVKPHPTAVLPLAISVRIMRDVLSDAGFDPNLVLLQTDTRAAAVGMDLCTRPEVKVIDFTGGNAFGEWLENNCRQAVVYTEKAGVNAVVVDDFANFKGLCRNLAFTLSLYSGQMCTTPQNIFIPRDGIKCGDTHMSFDDAAAAIAGAVGKFNSDPAKAVHVLGAIQAEVTEARIADSRKLGDILLDSQKLDHPDFPNARVHTPLILKIDSSERQKYESELFGPITFIVACDGIDGALEAWRSTVTEKGAITAALYSDNPDVQARAIEMGENLGVLMSLNLTGGTFVNQTAAFSDYHASGANPAANASLVDTAFVAGRFRVAETRTHVDPDPVE